MEKIGKSKKLYSDTFLCNIKIKNEFFLGLSWDDKIYKLVSIENDCSATLTAPTIIAEPIEKSGIYNINIIPVQVEILIPRCIKTIGKDRQSLSLRITHSFYTIPSKLMYDYLYLVCLNDRINLIKINKTGFFILRCDNYGNSWFERYELKKAECCSLAFFYLLDNFSILEII